METAVFLAILLCLGAVVFWYVDNEAHGADGSHGVLAIRADSDTADDPQNAARYRPARTARAAADDRGRLADAARVRARIDEAQTAPQSAGRYAAKRRPGAAAAFAPKDARAFASVSRDAPRSRKRADKRPAPGARPRAAGSPFKDDGEPPGGDLG
ncbi:MAG: hypothetical protein AAGC56_09295 [Pseudomonadota bacterium]